VVTRGNLVVVTGGKLVVISEKLTELELSSWLAIFSEILIDSVIKVELTLEKFPTLSKLFWYTVTLSEITCEDLTIGSELILSIEAATPTGVDTDVI
jgi:hypothetical protein